MTLRIAQAQVKDFMLAAEQVCPPTPIIADVEVAQLRYNLINEELQEFNVAVNRYFMMADLYQEGEVLAQVADALADLLYVVIGSGVAFGIDLEPVFEEVHAANMRKFRGGHRRGDGKWMKPPDWRGPDVEAIIARQMA